MIKRTKDMIHILENAFVSHDYCAKIIDVTLIHSWQQEIKESQLKNVP